MSSDESTVEEFKIEAQDLLDEAERSLLALDKGGPFESNYNSIFRVFHSLKGAAGMLSLSSLQEHMHKTENLFQGLKTKGVISKHEIDFFLAAADGARKILDRQVINFDYEIITTQAAAAEPALKSVTAPASPKPPTLSASPFQLNAVVVDDETEMVEVCCNLLRTAGFNATGFTDAQVALEQINVLRPSVVLTDVSMPGMDGTQFLSAIRKLSSELPVIFVTAFATKDTLLEAIAQGVFDVVEKPFRGTSLISSAIRGAKHYQLIMLIKRSINMLVYQFADLEDFFISQNRQDQRVLIKGELENLRKQYKALLGGA